VGQHAAGTRTRRPTALVAVSGDDTAKNRST